MDGFSGWNGHDWGVPNVSSVQDYDHGPEGATRHRGSRRRAPERQLTVAARDCEAVTPRLASLYLVDESPSPSAAPVRYPLVSVSAIGPATVGQSVRPDHSLRRTSTGSVWPARRAGRMPLQAPRRAARWPRPSETGSIGLTPNSCEDNTRPVISATTTPIAAPAPITDRASPITSRYTSRASAPSAMRTPMSCVCAAARPTRSLRIVQ